MRRLLYILIYTTLSVAGLGMLSSCERLPSEDPDTPTMRPLVSKASFVNVTKADEDGYSTDFTDGDRIGIYSIKNGTIIDSGPWTFDGSSWSSASADGVIYDSEAYFFAYYPYDSGMDESGLDLSATTAEDFFNTYIQSFAVKTDQSSYSDYTASDLMVSTGVPESHDNPSNPGYWPVSFTMQHQMSLIVLKSYSKKSCSLNVDPGYNWYWELTANLSDNQLWDCEDDSGNHTLRYIIKPGTSSHLYVGGTYQKSFFPPYANNPSSVSETGFGIYINSNDLTKGYYYSYAPDGGFDTSSTVVELTNGDFYMTDGRIAEGGSSELYAALSSEDQGDIIGVVIIPTVSYYDSSVENALGHTPHGIVLSMSRSANGGNRSTIATIKKGVLWASSNDLTPDGVPSYTGAPPGSTLLGDIAGYQSTKNIQAIADYATKYPAFYYASEYYQDNYFAAPSTPVSTGWFLPSPGQWAAIWKTFCPDAEYSATGGENGATWQTYGKKDDNVYITLNNYLSYAGGGSSSTSNYTAFGTGQGWYWCSAQNGEYGHNVQLKDNWKCIFGWNNKKTTEKSDGSGCVRPFLIF